MSIRGVLFDKDGTLIDVNATWVPIYRHVLMDLLGVDQDGAEAMMAKAGYDRASGRFRAGSALAGGTTRQIAAIWWPDLEGDALDEKIHALDNDYTHLVRERLEPLMPLEPILAELRGMGLVLGVATNDSHVSAIAHMTHVGNMVRRFAEITGLPAASIAMVGDNHHDMEEARAGGAGLAIAVLSGNAAHEDIAHLADHTIASIAELPSLLRSL
jgi:phosphoglycolate phosphatase